MGIPCHVNTAIDVTVGMLTHSLIPPPPAPPVKVPAVPSVEMIATQMWTLGFLCGQNKFTTTVLHWGLPLVQEGHDQGMMIPDITIPPANIWYLVMWPFSSRKIMFFSSLVHYDKKGAGCAALFLPFPMMTCGEPISAPTARPITNLLNTVIVSLSPGDIIMGVARIAFSMALDATFNKLSSPSPPGTGRAWSQAGKEVLNKLCPTDALGWAKLALSGLSGVFFPSPTDGPKFEVKIGLPGVAEAGVSISGSESSVGVSAFGGNDNQGGFGAAASTGVKYGDAQGTRGFAAGAAGDHKGEVSTADPPSSSGGGAKGGSGTGAKGSSGGGGGGGGGGTSSPSSGGSGSSAKGSGGGGSQSGGGGSQSSGGEGTTLGGGGSQSPGSGAKGTTGGGSQSPGNGAKGTTGGGSQSPGGGAKGSNDQSSGDEAGTLKGL